MKLNKQNAVSKKTIISILGAVIVTMLVAGVVYGAITYFEPTRSETSERDTPTEDSPATKEQNARDKENFINNVDLPEQNTDNDQQTNPATTDISMEVSQADSDVIVTTKLPSFSAGTCKLSITNGQKIYTDSADIIYQPSYSSCMGFSVPVARLGGGTWKITLNANNTKLTGTTSKEFRVEQQ